MISMLLPLLIGGLVIAMVALLYSALRKNTEGAAADRLDQLVGRNVRKDSSADMLLKQALQEVGRKTLMDKLIDFMKPTRRSCGRCRGPPISARSRRRPTRFCTSGAPSGTHRSASR